MPFAAGTRDRVMAALELPLEPEWIELVDMALTRAETYGGDAAVTRITGYLTKLEAAEASLNSGAANAGLVRADVLEWAVGAKTAGYAQEMERLRGLILNSLFVPIERERIKPAGVRSNRVRINRG